MYKKCINKIATISTTQRSIIRKKYFKQNIKALDIARYIIASEQNIVDKMYTARKAINIIITEEKQSTQLEWLNKENDMLSEEDLFKIPLNPAWKIKFDYI